MDTILWGDLYEAVAGHNSAAVVNYSEEIGYGLLDEWRGADGDQFEKQLRLYIQKSQRMKRELISPEQEISYQLGLIAGMIRAMEQIYRFEGEDQKIIESLAKSSGKTRQILDCLYKAPERGMQHSDLAIAIASSTSSLTNLMKKVLQSGAVEASREGKFTFYMLTTAGERYCKQQNGSQHETGVLPDTLKTELVEIVTTAVKHCASEARVNDRPQNNSEIRVEVAGNSRRHTENRESKPNVFSAGALYMMENGTQDNRNAPIVKREPTSFIKKAPSGRRTVKISKKRKECKEFA